MKYNIVLVKIIIWYYMKFDKLDFLNFNELYESDLLRKIDKCMIDC